ncbi:MAG: hypothetical protein PHR86_11820, partial [Desulfobacterales bacterium]|nr:hypothetical protein [Desulfobacterales bacterium]
KRWRTFVVNRPFGKQSELALLYSGIQQEKCLLCLFELRRRTWQTGFSMYISFYQKEKTKSIRLQPAPTR